MSGGPEETRPVIRRPRAPDRFLTGQSVDRYEVGERLGMGGMGEVYGAWDPLLKRKVALKRVRADTVSDAEGRERVLHEARALSSLSHPAIASIYDVVEAHDQLFLVEEFVPGTPLREMLGGPLDLEVFRPIAEGCLSALAEAERRGIVHCDIKPDNIVLDRDGKPKILDFGLARRMAPAAGTDDADTRVQLLSGLRGGTTSYMAPEALVDSRADPRSDLWSLGVVFYEALTARHPFRGGTATETATNILTTEPDEPGRVRPGLPASLDAIVMAMLAKKPEDRSASAADLLGALRGGDAPVRAPYGGGVRRPVRRFALAAGAVAIAAAAWLAWGNRTPPAVPERPAYLAIGTFETPGAESDADAFTRGLIEETARILERADHLSVVPADVPFRVDASWHGELQLVVDRLRMSYEVIGADSTASGDVLMGGTDEIFALRDRLARDVLRLVGPRVGPGDLALPPVGPPPTTPATYLAYLRGVGHLAPDGDVTAAVRYFEAAVDGDPGFVPARIGLADALWRAADGDDATTQRALRTAREAVELAPGLTEARRTLGRILLESGDPAAAERELAPAFDLDPADAETSNLLATAQRHLDRDDDAIRTLTAAADANPSDWRLQRNLGMQLYQLGRLEDARLVCERMVRLTPGNARGRSTLGAICYYLGRNSEAIDAYLESIAIEPNYRAYSNIATIYMAEQRFEEAATNLEAALRLDDSDYRVWANLAATYETLPGRDADLVAANARSIELAEAHLRDEPGDAAARALLGLGYAIAGRIDDARRAIGDAITAAPDDMDALFYAAGVEERLGDRARALELAERALRAGIPVSMMEAEPAWRDLVSSPEFREIAARFRGSSPEGA